MQVIRFNKRKAILVVASSLVLVPLFYVVLFKPVYDHNADVLRDDAHQKISPPNWEKVVDLYKTKAFKVLSSQQFAAFDRKKPKSLVIMTYQRSGSSLVGDMFSHYPEAFYLFEPLDALYVAMYGINHGWSVPSDITHYWNGTHRTIPADEILAVAEYIEHLLSCDVAWLPTESLTHNFWRVHRHHMNHLADYIECVIHNNLTFPVCEHANPWACGQRFGQADDLRQAACRDTLWHARRRTSTRSGPGINAQSSAGKQTGAIDNLETLYAAYTQCLDSVRLQLDERCSSILRNSCERRTLRVVKATRASMQSVGELLDRRRGLGDVNTRVVHSYRDPRAVATSRHLQGDPLLGKHAAFVVDSDPHESIIREARMYCRTAADDFRYRINQLDRRHPGAVASLDFDVAAQDVVGAIEAVYKFLDIAPVPAPVREWADAVANRSRSLSNNWQKQLTVELSNRILALDECVQLCQYINCR